MATTPRSRTIEYPISDGKPMAETQVHAQDLMETIQTLWDHFAAEPDVYTWGNMLLFYEEGNPRRHVSPDVFFVRGIPKEPPRLYYLVWEEGKAPDAVIELTSKSTRSEDQKKKLVLYRDTLKIPEYFLFDPYEEYLKPSMQGYRLDAGEYRPIERVQGRLPSQVLGLHLERDGTALRLFDPRTGRRLPTRKEAAEQADQERQAAEARARLVEDRARLVETENDRLRREVEELRRRLEGAS